MELYFKNEFNRWIWIWVCPGEIVTDETDSTEEDATNKADGASPVEVTEVTVRNDPANMAEEADPINYSKTYTNKITTSSK